MKKLICIRMHPWIRTMEWGSYLITSSVPQFGDVVDGKECTREFEPPIGKVSDYLELDGFHGGFNKCHFTEYTDEKYELITKLKSLL